MVFLYLIFYACRRLRFLDVEINPGPRHPANALSRILCIRMRLHTYEMVTEYFANPNLSKVVAECRFLGCVALDRTFMCSVFTATLT